MQGSDGPGRQTYTMKETARILDVALGTAYAGCRQGTIPCVRVGRRLLVPREALHRILAGDPRDGTVTATDSWSPREDGR